MLRKYRQMCLFSFQELAALDVIHKSVWVEVRQIVIKFSDIHVSDRNWSLDAHCDKLWFTTSSVDVERSDPHENTYHFVVFKSNRTVLGSTKAFERFTSLAKLVSSEINSRYIFFTVSSSLLPTLESEMDISWLTQDIVLFSADNVTLSVHVHGFSVEFCRPESLSERY